MQGIKYIYNVTQTVFSIQYTRESQPLYKKPYKKSLENIYIGQFSRKKHVSPLEIGRMFKYKTVALG